MTDLLAASLFLLLSLFFLTQRFHRLSAVTALPRYRHRRVNIIPGLDDIGAFLERRQAENCRNTTFSLKTEDRNRIFKTCRTLRNMVAAPPPRKRSFLIKVKQPRRPLDYVRRYSVKGKTFIWVTFPVDIQEKS